MTTDRIQATKNDLATWLITTVLLVYALFMHLIPALFAGLRVYHLIYWLATPTALGNNLGTQESIQ